MRSKKQETAKIKEIVESRLPGAKVVLFGSRARGDFDEKSDYDLLIEIPEDISLKEKMNLTTKINKLLVDHDVVADVIIQSRREVERKKNYFGSVVREAIKNGIEL